MNSTSIIDRLAIQVPAGASREYVYTDKVAAHWSGETSMQPTRSYHGLCVRMQKLLETWRFQLNDIYLESSEQIAALIYPHMLVRFYDRPSVREKICLLDGIGTLVVDLEGKSMASGVWWPLVDIRPVRQPQRPSYQTRWLPKENLLLIGGDRFTKGSPRWIGFSGNVPLNFSPGGFYQTASYRRGRQRGVLGEGYPYQPGALLFHSRRSRVRFLCVAGGSPREVREKIRREMPLIGRHISRKRKRLEQLLSRCPVQTDWNQLNDAIAWARISLDTLVMRQEGWGIYAGFPWFANYWGRDTGISLPGATWVTGQFALAKNILTALASQQDRRPGSATLGRIPNLLEPGTKLYNTADGTLWFVRQLYEYGRYSGDLTTLRDLFPTIRRAIQGEIRHRIDPHGLVLHGSAETWMDAGGDSHPITPRDDRAVEIQVLWQTALVSGAQLASMMGYHSLAMSWQRLARQVSEVFLARYWDPIRGYLYDHLNPDGSPDQQIRPNALLALTVPWEPLLSPKQERSVLNMLLKQLVYPHGVSTLPPEDAQFRSHHLSGGRYHFDEAYHNGDIWPWLSGPLITALVRHGQEETAQVLTNVLIDHLLNKGAAGTLSELFNASPTAENDNEAGAYSQAWSLAEFIRVIYQDYLGVRPNALKNQVILEPAVPLRWGSVRFRFAVAKTMVDVHYQPEGTGQRYHIRGQGGGPVLELLLRLRLPGRGLMCLQRVLNLGKSHDIEVKPWGKGCRVRVDGHKVTVKLEKIDAGMSEIRQVFREPLAME